MFYKSKKDGLTFEEWKQAWRALSERFAVCDDSVNVPDLYRFNLSPIQALKVIYNLEVDIKKNQQRIYLMQGFGKRLVEVMDDLSITQLRLSEELGITQPQVYHYRVGKSTPRPAIRQKLASTLSTDYLWLSWGIGIKKYYREERFPEEQMHFTFGERLTFSMMIKKYSIEGISQRMGVTHQAFQNWMEGKRKPKLSMIRAIAKDLRVDFDWLRGYKPG